MRGPPLKPEVQKLQVRVSYSFRDVLALRRFVYLRAHDVSLQRVRRTVKQLRSFGETQHLSAYTLVALGRDVAWLRADDDVVALTSRPLQQIIAEMAAILGAFKGLHGREVVPLLEPAPGIRVDPEVRGGYPVIDGTRVPFDLVAGLLADGMTESELKAFYPTVSARAARGALTFARYVAGHRDAAAA
jgi:uncharacterized protein (DUF433 family)